MSDMRADKPTYCCPNCGSHGTLPVCCGQTNPPNNVGRAS